MTKSRSYVKVLYHSLALLAVAGLIMAGGVMSHFDAAAAFHMHEVSAGGQTPDDSHTHLDSDLPKQLVQGAPFHCGADLLLLCCVHDDYGPLKKATRSVSNDYSRLSFVSGCDPPPPRSSS